jgi:hypothetical protein
MADIRIKDLATTATTTASDDFMAVDGATNGTRKLSAATPAFLTSVTTPSLTSPASTNLTLAGGAGNSSIILTPAGTGYVGIGTTNPSFPLESKITGTDSTIWGYNVAQFADATANQTGLRIGTNTSTSGLTELVAATNSAASQFGFWTFSGSAWGERMRIKSNGDTTISSSTAGASNAGALVVTGGLSAGAASYFGGAVTANGTVQVTANTTPSGGSGLEIQGGATPTLFAYNRTGSAYLPLIITGSTLSMKMNNVDAFTLTGASAAASTATFAGAVTIGNTVNTVSPTSPNRTITMVVNGVTLYLAAKTTND